jgi:hypothetical protein
MPSKSEPRHFYLNEQHELTREEREGGGSLPKLAAIDWTAKQTLITSSLAKTKSAIEKSDDPLRQQRYFLLALPEPSIRKLSSDKRKAPGGEFDEMVDYAGKDAKALGRLGLDVVSVTESGAIVHASPERFERLETISAHLTEVGPAEQARWALLSRFDVIPENLRADKEWLDRLAPTEEHEAIIELQPMLTRSEGNIVLTSIAERLKRPQREAIIGSGTDFSGRGWVRVRLGLETILTIIRGYFSIQSLHGPLTSAFVASSKKGTSSTSSSVPAATNLSVLPTVGVVDGGVPTNHPQLESFRRGTFIDPGSMGMLGEHGTRVASRIVYGDPRDPLIETVQPSCRFLDIIVSRDAGSAEDKIISGAVNTAAANYSDVRTFNLSLGDYRAFESYAQVERSERLILTQDLDNVVFARDIIVVVAAGNSAPGVLPSSAYPDHWQDTSWRLGHWALGFNTLTCGSFVRDWSILGGVATVPYSPSPFTRVGFGLAESPVPDFSAHGGNSNPSYGWSPGLGVYGLSLAGLWEDKSGTSFAAPLLARECAFGFQALQAVCPPGSKPFGVTVKALLALTAASHSLPQSLDEIARRTLGHGEANSALFSKAEDDAAIFLWQGTIMDKTDRAKVVLPIPVEWVTTADDPVCEIAVAWDSPVNAAFPNIYGCRRVDTHLRPVETGKAVRARHGSHPSYPLRIRTYPLKRFFEKEPLTDDLWTVELSYDELCEYPPTQTFIPEQRVAFALRLRDRSGKASPQEFVQTHALAPTMTRLSAAILPTQIPVSVKIQ